MEQVAINVGGRTMLVDIKTAQRVRKQAEINRQHDRRVSRELKESRLGPSCPHNQFAGWIGNDEIHHARPLSLIAGAKATTTERWQEFMLLGR